METKKPSVFYRVVAAVVLLVVLAPLVAIALDVGRMMDVRYGRGKEIKEESSTLKKPVSSATAQSMPTMTKEEVDKKIEEMRKNGWKLEIKPGQLYRVISTSPAPTAPSKEEPAEKSTESSSFDFKPDPVFRATHAPEPVPPKRDRQ